MEKITSINSPHIERVKALIGSRGKKNRELENAFVAEGIQTVREALTSKIAKHLMVERLYLTESGSSKLISDIGTEILDQYEVILV
jgi:TrmH family RNA methyltransferase